MTRKENYDELLIAGSNVADTLAAKAESSEVDSLSTTVGEKADQDGGGTASLSNYASVDTDSASVTNDLSAGSVDTDELTNTSEKDAGERPVFIPDDITINVPGDVATIQEAIDQIPLYCERTNVRINIDDGTYNEDILVPYIIGKRANKQEGEGGQVLITGNRTTPGNVEFGSLMTTGLSGTSPLHVRGVTFTQETPYDNEDVAVASYGGSGSLAVVDCEFASGINHGCLAYNGNLYANNVGFGDGNLAGDAFFTKYDGWIFVKDGAASGSVGRYAYSARGGGYIQFEGNAATVTGTEGLVESGRGMVQDVNNNIVYGMETLPANLDLDGNELRNASFIRGEATANQQVQFQGDGDLGLRVPNSDDSGGITGVQVASGTAYLHVDSGQVNIGSNGAHIYVNGSGELVAVDDAGNETTLT